MSTNRESDSDDTLTEEKIRAVVRDELNNHNEDGDEISRRDFGKAGVLAALGLGGAAGVGGRQAVENAVEPAKASHGGGTIGEEGDPVGSIYAHQFGSSTEPIQTLHADSQTDFTVGTLNADELLTTFYTSTRGSDGTAIQSALDDAAATSGWTRVVVDPIGTAPYVVSNAPLTVPSKTIVELREHVKLAGSTQENVFQNKNHFDDAVEDTDIWFVGNGGKVDGNKANNTERSSDSTGYGIGSKQNGISLIGVTRAGVTGVQSVDNVLHGIDVMGADNVVISDNYTEGNRYAGVHSHWRMTDSRKNTNFCISGNQIVNGGQNGGESGGVYVSGGDDHRIVDNEVDTRDNMGITVAGKVNQCSNIVISDNIVRDVAATTTYKSAGGIRVWSGTDLTQVTITGNTIDNGGATNNDQVGISALVKSGASSTISRLMIAENTIYTQAHSISLRGTGGYVQDFTVANNFVTNFNFGYAKGIEVRDAKEGNVSDNIVTDCQGSGIHVETNNRTAAKIGVFNNMSYANGRGGNAGDQYGIRLLGPDDTTITGNRCWQGLGNQTHGIYSDSGTSDTVALLNDLRGNGTAGHSLNGTGAITDAVGQATAEDWNVT